MKPQKPLSSWSIEQIAPGNIGLSVQADKSDEGYRHQASASSRSPHPRESRFLTSFRATTFSHTPDRSHV
jgi:hypothetical protein